MEKLTKGTEKVLFNLKNNKIVGKSGLYLKKYSPEILIGIGVVGLVASTVTACKATLKVDEILKDTNEKLEAVKEVKAQVENGSIKAEYDDKTAAKDKGIIYVQCGLRIVKLYLPSVTLGIAGIGCILGAHNIMQKRNAALLLLYKGVEESFNNYRNRVVEEYGEEKDKEFAYGLRKEKTVETVKDENGKEKKVKRDVTVTDGNVYSRYARFFDEYNMYWKKSPEYNLMFLTQIQNYANDTLKARGHIFLNEVYDMLGIQRTQEGAIVGWLRDGDKDCYVDFGIHNVYNEKARDFVNGIEPAILLDFNVDGVIYDMI